MNRFVQCGLIIGSCVLLFSGCSGSPNAVPFAGSRASMNAPGSLGQSLSTVNTIVYPTGVFPDDVQSVQAAVNQGGTVLLKAVNAAGQPTAFNFGTPEFLPGRRVLLTTNVSVVGEQVGAHMTTIQGGLVPIRGVALTVTRIQGIDFEDPMGDAINIGPSLGTQIIGNRINGIVPLPFPSIGITQADGIDVGSFGVNNTTGTLRIADNVIQSSQNSIQNPADLSIGIQLDTVAANSEISGNGIHGFQSFPILALRCHNSIAIENNAIDHVGALAGSAMWVEGSHDALYWVSGNSVTIDTALQDGIVAGGDNFGDDGTTGAVIEKNTITMHNSQFGAVSLYGLVTGSTVGENKIAGDSAFALQANEGLNPTDLASSNRFQGNNISQFTSSVADVFLGPNTIGITVAGNCHSLVNVGTGNFVTCGKLTTGNRSSLIAARVQKQQTLQNVLSTFNVARTTIPIP